MGKGIIKELFILILLIAVIFTTLSILFYDFFHNTQEIPEIKEYITESNVKATLQEIEEESQGTENGDSLLKSYEINKADLKVYEVKGSYDKGKVNPFSDVASRVVDNTTAEGGNNNSTNQNVTNNTNQSGSSQGTFFENPNSK